MGNEVTILAYHWQDDANYEKAFERVAFAVRETWRWCGALKTVLVVNRVKPCVEKFAEEGNVQIRVEPSLIPGEINTMSFDCNGKLHTRFETNYVLIVQNDGYPLRDGLDTFVGKYDFIGAPYIRDSWWKRLICKSLNLWVSNGGFSLRSKNICEQAAFYWNKKYSREPMRIDFSEDLFYTKFLPLHERAYRKSVILADNRQALDFSYDAIVPYTRDTLPFGFHGEKARAILQKQFSRNAYSPLG